MLWPLSKKLAPDTGVQQYTFNEKRKNPTIGPPAEKILKRSHLSYIG